MNTQDIRKQLNITQAEFSTMFGIPIRTVQNWDYRDCMPDYIHNLIMEVYQLRMYNKILKKQIRD